MSPRSASERLDALEVLARRRRQSFVRADADGAFHRAGQLLVDRVAALELLGAHRQDLGEGALELTADTDLHRLDAVYSKTSPGRGARLRPVSMAPTRFSP